MRLGQTSIILTTSKVLGSVTGFFATVYFARELGSSVLGQYALVMALVSWVGLLGNAGLSQAINKRLSEGEERPEFLGAAIVAIGSLFALAAVCVLLFSSQINDYVGRQVATFVVLILFVSFLTTISQAVLHGTHLVHVEGVLAGGERILRTAAQVGLVVVGYGLAGMLFGYALSGFFLGLVGILYVGLRPSMPTRQHVTSLFDFAKFSWLGDVSNRAYTNLDIAVLGVFVSSTLVGVYSVSWSIAAFLTIFGRSIAGTLFPEMSRIGSTHGEEAVGELTEESLRYNGLIGIPGLVGAWVVGDRLLSIYGPEFSQGENILVVLIGAAVVYSYVNQLRNTLNAIDRPDLAFKTNGVFLCVNAVLNVVLVAYFGWFGAAMATLVSAVVAGVLAFRYAHSTVGFEFPITSISCQWGAALLMGVLVSLLRTLGETHAIFTSNALFVVVLVGIGGAVYVGLLFAIWPPFRTTVWENLPVEGALK